MSRDAGRKLPFHVASVLNRLLAGMSAVLRETNRPCADSAVDGLLTLHGVDAESQLARDC